mgnify:FL=1|jgi:hypothetical protein
MEEDLANDDTPVQGSSSKMFGILGHRMQLGRGVNRVSLTMDDIDEDIILNS